MVNQEELSKVHNKIQGHFNKYANKIMVSQHIPEKHHSVGRKEGEKWKDRDGKLWEVKHGIVQSVSKLQDAKTPWWCPKCTRPLNSDLHLKMYRKRRMCHRCVLEEDTQMRLNGTFEDFQDKKLLQNKMAFYRDRVIELAYFLENLHAPEFQIFNEDTGTMVMVEKWEVPLDQLRKDVSESLEHVIKVVTEMEEMYRERWGYLPGEEPDSNDEGEQT